MATHNIKLVQGSEDTISETPAPEDKKKATTLTVSLTAKELKQMKALSGLKGNVSNDQIIKSYIKSKLTYGW
jgi:hypothetical protein